MTDSNRPSSSEAAVCPRCGKPASVTVGRYVATAIEKRLLTCEHCRFFEMSELPRV